MISGSFHTTAQEWRYYSREKSLIHTLHLAQLVSSKRGDTVEVASTSPASNGGGGFSQPPLQIPPGSGLGGGVETVTFTFNTLSTCYGSVGLTQNILTQKNMIIEFGVWLNTRKEILMTPQEAGWFLIHAEFVSGERGFETPTGGVGGATAHALGVLIDRQPFPTTIGGFDAHLFMSGFKIWPTDTDGWRPTQYLSTILSNGSTFIAVIPKGVMVRSTLTNTTNPVAVEDTTFSMWMLKFAEP